MIEHGGRRTGVAGGREGESVVIERRFNGPPDSAHGGYACALAAGFLDYSAQVSLRRPPPLERPLSVRRGEGGSVALEDAGEVVIEARPAQLDLEVPKPVSLAEAEAAKAASPWLEAHPFPTCFGCGPERPSGDGLFEFPGPVPGRPELWATVWTPDETLADAAGAVLPIFTFAALDCPSAAGAVSVTGAPGVHVLARMNGRLVGTARVGEPHVVIAWPVGHEQRKRFGGVAIFAGGELCAVAEALWVALRDPGDFNARASSFSSR